MYNLVPGLPQNYPTTWTMSPVQTTFIVCKGFKYSFKSDKNVQGRRQSNILGVERCVEDSRLEGDSSFLFANSQPGINYWSIPVSEYRHQSIHGCRCGTSWWTQILSNPYLALLWCFRVLGIGNSTPK